MRSVSGRFMWILGTVGLITACDLDPAHVLGKPAEKYEGYYGSTYCDDRVMQQYMTVNSPGCEVPGNLKDAISEINSIDRSSGDELGLRITMRRYEDSAPKITRMEFVQVNAPHGNRFADCKEVKTTKNEKYYVSYECKINRWGGEINEYRLQELEISHDCKNGTSKAAYSSYGIEERLGDVGLEGCRVRGGKNDYYYSSSSNSSKTPVVYYDINTTSEYNSKKFPSLERKD